MPADALVPERVLSLFAAATVFGVMLDLGLGVVIGEFRGVFRHPIPLAKGLFAALVAVPAIALAITRLFDLPRAADIGIVLMAISPGAPVALRRAIDAGGDRSFAPALQIAVALLAVVSMPATIALLEIVYAGHAAASPLQLARQVFFAQLLPLTIGMLVRRTRPELAARMSERLGPVSNFLLVALTGLVLIDVSPIVADAGPRIVLAMATLTLLALAAGHTLGGPDAETRTAVAISSAVRNPGLALLVATLNSAAPPIVAAIFAYLVVSGVLVLVYVLWRRRTGAGLRASPS